MPKIMLAQSTRAYKLVRNAEKQALGLFNIKFTSVRDAWLKFRGVVSLRCRHLKGMGNEYQRERSWSRNKASGSRGRGVSLLSSSRALRVDARPTSFASIPPFSLFFEQLPRRLGLGEKLGY